MPGGIAGGGGNQFWNPNTGRYESNNPAIGGNAGGGSTTGPLAGNIPYGGTPSPLTNQYNLYNAGVKTNTQDYDSIMEGYKRLFNSPSANSASKFTPWTPQQLGAPTPYTAQRTNYNPSANTTASLANLKNLSETGGYSAEDISNLRARGISPIRSVYANAQQGIDRSRALQGGYSPSYNAVTSKMTREMSDQIANATQNVNAEIAENVAKGRLNIAPQYASASGNEDRLRAENERINAQRQDEANRFNLNNINEINRLNANSANEANKYNSEGTNKINQQNIDRQLEALRGMTSIYG